MNSNRNSNSREATSNGNSNSNGTDASTSAAVKPQSFSSVSTESETQSRESHTHTAVEDFLTLVDSGEGEEVDVDELAESISQIQQSSHNDHNDDDSETAQVESKELRTIAHELDAVDRMAKQEARTNATEVRVGAIPVPGPNSHETPPTPRTQAVARRPSSTSRNQPPSVGKANLKKQPPPPKQDPNGLPKKERDAAGDDDEINPVLLRHLAEQHRLQPGAFPSSTRPPNMQMPPSAASNPSLLATRAGALAAETTTSRRHHDAQRMSAPPILQGSSSHSHASIITLTTNSAAALPAGSLHHQPQADLMIEASLVRANSLSPDLEEQESTSHDDAPTQRRQDATAQLPQVPPPNDNANPHTPQQHQHLNAPPPPVIVRAKNAGLRDYLQNRTFRLFLAGYFIAILTIIGLVAGILILQQQHHVQIQNLQEQYQLTPTSAPVYPLNDQEVILDMVGTVFREYVNPQLGNQAQFDAFQWLNRHPHLEYDSDKHSNRNNNKDRDELQDVRLMPDFVKIQLYSLATIFHALNGWDWPTLDRGDFLSYTVSECDWMKKFDIQMCNSSDSSSATTDEDAPVILAEDQLQEEEEQQSSLDNRENDNDKKDSEDKDNDEQAVDDDQLTAPTAAPWEDRVVKRLQVTGDANYNIPGVRGYMPPEVGFLTQLHTIYIGYTTLDAELHDMLPTQLETLADLTMLAYPHNQLRSTIPTRLTRLDKLTRLELQFNQLTGPIPSQLGSALTQLTSLHLEHNRLGSNGNDASDSPLNSIPSELALLSSTLMELFLYENLGIRGHLPTEFAALTALTTLDVHATQLTGPLFPSELGRLTALQTLAVYQMPHMTGQLPTELGAMTSLKTIHMWGNPHMTGTVPSELGLLADSLKVLYLHRNPLLVGTIPSELALLTKLKRLFLHETGLTGPIPTALCQMSTLKLFEVNCLKVDCPPQDCVCQCYKF